MRGERGGGVADALLEAAVAFAADQGATAVEGYPKDTEGARKHANEMFVGSMSMFAEAGFTEAGRRSPTRPIMRREVGVRGLKASPPVNGVSGRGGPGGRGGSR